MKIQIPLLTLLVVTQMTIAQNGYEADTWTALQTMWNAETDEDRAAALALYEAAFQRYPDSIEEIGLYKASVLAGELWQLDKSFDYLYRLHEEIEDQATGWDYVAGEYGRSEWANLVGDPRWAALERQQLIRKEQFFQQLAASEAEFRKPATVRFDGKGNFPVSAEFLPKEHRHYSLQYAFDDTTATSYFVALPENYDPQRSYPMLVFLHGAVRHNEATPFQNSEVLDGWNRFYTKYADRDEVILVFPQADKRYNWMTTLNGFDYLPNIVAEIKRAVNVDDDRVFVSGHSNGATGSFNYWLRQPTAFAGFFGFNTYPKVFTGGTFLGNGNNRSYVNFSTDEDYYYPTGANDSLTLLANRLGLEYEDRRYPGFPHWFPEFDESEPAVASIFERMKTVRRDPFPREIYREIDDLRDGRADWLEITALDTTAAPAAWQRNHNFGITEWLDYDDNDSLVVLSVDKRAFAYPRRSGAVRAEYENNRFDLTTSRVGAVRLYLSPSMIDWNQPIFVYIDGKQVHSGRLSLDREVLSAEYARTGDRRQVYGAVLDFRVE